MSTKWKIITAWMVICILGLLALLIRWGTIEIKTFNLRKNANQINVNVPISDDIDNPYIAKLEGDEYVFYQQESRIP